MARWLLSAVGGIFVAVVLCAYELPLFWLALIGLVVVVSIRAAWSWFACDYQCQNSRPDAMEAIVAIHGVLLGGMVAVGLLVQQQKPPYWPAASLYFVLSSLPLMALCMIASVKNGSEPYFNRGSVKIARWTLVLSAVLVLWVSERVLSGAFPGQSPEPIAMQPLTGREYTFQCDDKDRKIDKGDKGLEIEYVISPALFNNQPYPNPLVFSVYTGSKWKGSWKPIWAYGFEVKPGATDLHVSGEAAPRLQSIDDDKASLWWHDLDPNKSYRLVIRFHRIEPSKEPSKFLKELSEGKDGFEVVVYHRPSDK